MISTDELTILQDQSKSNKLHKRSLPNIALHPNDENLIFTCKSNPELTLEPFQIPTLHVEPQRQSTQNSDFANRQGQPFPACGTSISSGLLLSLNKMPLVMSKESQIGSQTESEIGRTVHSFEQEQEHDDMIVVGDREMEKIEAQISAAKRSMITNLILGGIFCIFAALLVFLPDHLRPFGCEILLSFFKAAMPIFTTIANFGTVRFVLSQYWHSYINDQHCCCQF
jgi:hypothetical protein